MTRLEDHKPEAISDAVNGFKCLEARQMTIHTWRVLSWRGDEITAHKVDVRDLTCTCPDHEFNKRDPQICDHLAVALHSADRTMDVGDAISHDMSQRMLELDKHVQAIERRAAGIQAETEAGGSQSPSDGADSGPDGFSGDPVECFEDLLRDEGLDPDKFSLWVDDELGSLQIDQDGYLEHDEFNNWRELSDDLELGYDGDEDVNYLKSDRFSEVLA